MADKKSQSIEPKFILLSIFISLILTIVFVSISHAAVVTVNEWSIRGHAMPQLHTNGEFKNDYLDKNTDLHNPAINGDKPLTYNDLLNLPDNWDATAVTFPWLWE